MAWSVDRLGRSLQHLVGFLDNIHAKGVDLYLHQQNIDTSTPSGKAMFQMAGVFAEFERSMIQERVRAGLERAREQGKVFGPSEGVYPYRGAYSMQEGRGHGDSEDCQGSWCGHLSRSTSSQGRLIIFVLQYRLAIYKGPNGNFSPTQTFP